MALLEGVTWQGKVLKDGEWTDGRGGTYAVIEPATGNELGTMGQADAEDVAEAAASAAQAQKEWAALPHTARAAVLRRAGDLWAEHADEIDVKRAEVAVRRATERLAHPELGVDVARALNALHRAQARLKASGQAH